MTYTFKVPNDQAQLAEILQHVIDHWGERSAPYVFKAVPKSLRNDPRAMESFTPHMQDEVLFELIKGCRARDLMVLAYGIPQWVEGEGPDYADYYFQEVLAIPRLDFTMSSWTERALRRMLPTQWATGYSSTWTPADESTTILNADDDTR